MHSRSYSARHRAQHGARLTGWRLVAHEIVIVLRTIVRIVWGTIAVVFAFVFTFIVVYVVECVNSRHVPQQRDTKPQRKRQTNMMF